MATVLADTAIPLQDPIAGSIPRQYFRRDGNGSGCRRLAANPRLSLLLSSRILGAELNVNLRQIKKQVSQRRRYAITYLAR